MTNPAPVLRLRGTVHSEPVYNPVPAVPARPEQRDANGVVTRPAYPARDGYDKHDVNVLTEDGGFVTLVMRDEALAQVEGYMPAKGDVVDLPVRAYVAWRGEPPRMYAVPGVSLAGDVLAAELRSSTGSRVSAVS